MFQVHCPICTMLPAQEKGALQTELVTRKQ